MQKVSNSKEKTIKDTIVLRCNGKYLSQCTRDKASALIAKNKAIRVDEETIRLTYSLIERNELKAKTIKDAKRICYICGRKIPLNEMATIDHIIPKSRDEYADMIESNMRCCCLKCNQDKANRTLMQYVNYISANRYKYTYISNKRLKYLKGYALKYQNEYYTQLKKAIKQ